MSCYFHKRFSLNKPGIARITKLPAKLLVISNTSLTSVTKKLIINIIATIQNTIKYLAQVGVGLLINIRHSIYFLQPKHVAGKCVIINNNYKIFAALIYHFPSA